MKTAKLLLAALALCLGSLSAAATTRYVNVNSTSPTPPYDNWAKASTNIQVAVDAAGIGDLILVTNGVYAIGGRAARGLLTNVVAVTKPMRVQSVNGSDVTVIMGQHIDMPFLVMRGVYLTNGAVLSGFGVTQGSARAGEDTVFDRSGGGIWCESQAALVTNCVVYANAADQQGGGIYSGTIKNCTISGNAVVTRGGVIQGAGGGAAGAVLIDCTVNGNTAGSAGGVIQCGLSNCTLSGNVTGPSGVGGGAHTSSLTNCTISGNRAESGSGGGAYQGTLTNCLVLNNTAVAGAGTFESTIVSSTLGGNGGVMCYEGGGAYGGILRGCSITNNTAADLGAGVRSATLYNCTLVGNSGSSGAGASYSTLYNCALRGNVAAEPGYAKWGGGAQASVLNNCTLAANLAGDGGGAYNCALSNSIIYLNTVTNNFGTYWGSNYSSCTLNYCLTAPQVMDGVGNISNTPLFADFANGDLRLQPNSPCINAGLNGNTTGTTDLAGLPRIVSGTVDIGAYEYQGSGSQISYAWLQQYGWPTDGSADFLDPDGDGMNNWQEWRCGTGPTNALSVLKLLTPTGGVSGVTVSWQSVTNRSYWLERATNPASAGGTPTLQAFSSVASNIVGQAGTTSYTDATATNPAAAGFFYRVGVQP